MKSDDYIAVTSMSKQYFDVMGQYMLESWKKYSNLKLIVYSEDDLSFLNSDTITYKDWNGPCFQSWEKFCQGPVNDSEKKFAKKGFSIIESWKTLSAKRIVWIDADMIFKKNITVDVFDKMLPTGKLLSLFTHDCPDRYEGLSSESGLFIVDTQHNQFNNFVNEYNSIYNLGYVPQGIQSLGDHKILALVANSFIDSVEDLSKYRTKDKTTTPLNYSWIGEYMNHFKGNIKKKLDFSKESF